MQFAVITGPTFEIAKRRVKLAAQKKDGIELRLDLFKDRIDFESVKTLLDISDQKAIITLRKRSQGGGFLGREEVRQDTLLKILETKPTYIDIESDTKQSFLEKVNSDFPDTKIISSSHNYTMTPRDLEKTFNTMKNDYAYAYKLCTTANSFADAYKMLRFIHKKATEGLRIIGICMGEYGKITRREGIKAGNYLNYTILHNRDNCAPGLHLA